MTLASAPHRAFAELERRWLQTAPARREPGRLELIVLRPSTGERACPAAAEFHPERGIVGDRWLGANRPLAAQVSLMDVQVAAALCEREYWSLFGDNLFVDLDLSHAVLPPGRRLRVGEALIEISDEAHHGCKKFSARFGNDAMRWVNHKPHAGLRLRGIFAQILEGGSVRVGDVARLE